MKNGKVTGNSYSRINSIVKILQRIKLHLRKVSDSFRFFSKILNQFEKKK